MRSLGLIAFGFLAGFVITTMFCLALWHRQAAEIQRRDRHNPTRLREPSRPVPRLFARGSGPAGPLAPPSVT